MPTLKRTLPPLTSLVAFEAAARLTSITKAADELGVSRVAVSRQIKLLEDFLEISLFKRTNKTIELTSEGHLFFATISPSLRTIAWRVTNLRTAKELRESIRQFAQSLEQ